MAMWRNSIFQWATSLFGLGLFTPRALAEAKSSTLLEQQMVLKMLWSKKDFLQLFFKLPPLTLMCLFIYIFFFK